jgi:hypothetical protein
MLSAHRKAGTLPWTLLALFATAGCDIPTEVPKWDTTLAIPFRIASFAVEDVLPPNVVLSSGTLMVPTLADSTSASLSTLCGAPCTAVNGTTAPKPAFSGSYASQIAFPPDIFEKTFAAGNAPQFIIDNGFDFDPIRPAGAGGAKGTILTYFIAGTDTLAVDTLAGTTAALPPGARVTRSVAFPQGRSVGSQPIAVVQVVTSPAGDPVVVNTAESLKLVIPAGTSNLSRVSVPVPIDTLSSDTTTVDTRDIDTEVRQRVRGLGIELTTTNPFNVNGDIRVAIQDRDLGTDLQVSVFTLAAQATDTNRVVVDSATASQLLGRRLRMSVRTTLTSQGGTVSVAPADQVDFRLKLLFKIRIG